MQQHRVGVLGDLGRGRLVGGGRREQEADLGRRRGGRGRGGREQRAVPVRPQLQVELARGQTEVAGDALGQVVQHLAAEAVDVGEHVRVGDADQDGGLPAGRGRALELGRVLPGGLERRSLDPDRPRVEGGVAGVGRVEGAAGLPHPERIPVLVHHVRGHGQRGAGGGRVERLDGEPVVVKADEHASPARVGGAEATALGDLGAVPGRAGRQAAHQRNGGDEGGVGRAAGQDQIRARVEGGRDRLVAEHADDVRASAQGVGVKLAGRGQRADASGFEQREQRFGVLLAVDPRDGEG